MKIRTISLALLLSTPAFAGDPQFWTSYSKEVHDWFPTVMQPGHENEPPTMGHSCCAETDAFEVLITGENPVTGDIQVLIEDGKTLVPDGTEVSVPKSKLQWHYGNPVGKVILFMGRGGQVYCLAPLPGF